MFEEACRENNAEDVSRMLNLCWPVPVEIRTKKSESALMLASANGALEVCRVLIDLKQETFKKKLLSFYVLKRDISI
jgi:hypothetical protein